MLPSDDELTARVLHIVAETQRRDPATVSIDNTFDELSIDSMDAVNIVFAVENEFSIDVPDDDVRTIRTVRDVVDGVRRLVVAKASTAS